MLTKRKKDQKKQKRLLNKQIPSYSFNKPIEEITPKTKNQSVYVKALLNKDYDIVLGVGAAGTGKTLLASQAAVKMLREGIVKNIVIVRPAVGVDGEQHGFLPGDIKEKMDPWVKPVMQQLKKFYSYSEIKMMQNQDVIQIAPLAYMRGMTFDDSVIILDEAQNTSPNQLKMALTRIGNNSKVFINGDLEQHDDKFKENGLLDFINKFKVKPIARVCLVHFTNTDIVRHPIIDDILCLYGN